MSAVLELTLRILHVQDAAPWRRGLSIRYLRNAHDVIGKALTTSDNCYADRHGLNGLSELYNEFQEDQKMRDSRSRMFYKTSCRDWPRVVGVTESPPGT